MCLTPILLKSPEQYPWEPGRYPLGTDADILQRKPEASPFISKDAVVRVLDPVLTLNMISQDLKRNNLLFEILAHQVSFLLQDTYCSH